QPRRKAASRREPDQPHHRQGMEPLGPVARGRREGVGGQAPQGLCNPCTYSGCCLRPGRCTVIPPIDHTELRKACRAVCGGDSRRGAVMKWLVGYMAVLDRDDKDEGVFLTYKEIDAKF